MFKERENKWTRPRGFWEVNSGDIMMLVTALFFGALTIAGFAFFLFQPKVPGLSELFSDPPPPQGPIHLAPGEQEIQLFQKPGVPAAIPGTPKEPAKK